MRNQGRNSKTSLLTLCLIFEVFCKIKTLSLTVCGDRDYSLLVHHHTHIHSRKNMFEIFTCTQIWIGSSHFLPIYSEVDLLSRRRSVTSRKQQQQLRRRTTTPLPIFFLLLCQVSSVLPTCDRCNYFETRSSFGFFSLLLTFNNIIIYDFASSKMSSS